MNIPILWLQMALSSFAASERPLTMAARGRALSIRNFG